MLVKVLDLDPQSGIARVVDSRYVTEERDASDNILENYPLSHTVDAFIPYFKRRGIMIGWHYSMYPCNYFDRQTDAYIRYRM